jgi:hypothetical protein
MELESYKSCAWNFGDMSTDQQEIGQRKKGNLYII